MFTNVVSYSQKMINSNLVSKLRPLSMEIVKMIQNQSIITAIKGLRGVGKSSLLIYFLYHQKDSIYINAEYLLKQGLSLYEVLDYAYSQGYRVFGIDEIHVLKNWPLDVKLFYDQTRAKIVLTGSSAISLHITSSELSRRVVSVDLKPFSFREFIYFKTGVLLEKRTLKEILENKKEIAREIAPFVSIYNEFLEYYALPAAFFESKDVYPGIIEKIVYHDLISLKSIDFSYVDAAFKTLRFLVSSKPGEISYNSLASSLGKSVKFSISLINLLANAGILNIINAHGRGHKPIRSGVKISLPLSFRSALARYFNTEVEKGALREDFFIHHVGNAFYVKEMGRRSPDYWVDGYVFEIGGPSKGKSQLERSERGFLVKESLSTMSNDVPIYLFGLLY